MEQGTTERVFSTAKSFFTGPTASGEGNKRFSTASEISARLPMERGTREDVFSTVESFSTSPTARARVWDFFYVSL